MADVENTILFDSQEHGTAYRVVVCALSDGRVSVLLDSPRREVVVPHVIHNAPGLK